MERLINVGRMTAKEAAQSEHRNMIFHARPEEKVVTDLYRLKLENGDFLRDAAMESPMRSCRRRLRESLGAPGDRRRSVRHGL